MRHLLTLFDISPDEARQIFAIAADLKEKLAAGTRDPILSRQVLGLLFEKQSLRTRVSFETGIAHLGGSSIYLGQDVGWGARESIADFGRVLSQYIDALVFRGKCHKQLEELASYCECPVVNGLTDFAHPCQGLADLLTLQELTGDVAGQKLAFIGDGNNVARSLAVACALFDVELVVASPPGYEFDGAFLQQLRTAYPSSQLRHVSEPTQAVRGATAVYTDVWASMGQESEKAARRQAFAPYQVNAQLMQAAGTNPYFLHCLPAVRGEEVSAEVIDSPRSAVVQQAANRMHVQKGVLVWLLQQ